MNLYLHVGTTIDMLYRHWGLWSTQTLMTDLLCRHWWPWSAMQTLITWSTVHTLRILIRYVDTVSLICWADTGTILDKLFYSIHVWRDFSIAYHVITSAYYIPGTSRIVYSSISWHTNLLCRKFVFKVKSVIRTYPLTRFFRWLTPILLNVFKTLRE